MTERPFVDHYEVLQLSPNADSETIDRVYRLLAKRYHPDNQATGDSAAFAQLLEAHATLAEPDRRTEYDVHYDEHRRLQRQFVEESSTADGREQDRRMFHGVLSLLYIARRRHPNAGGLGVVNLERLLGISQEDLEFALWYMRQRLWITVLDTGEFAITVDGIDKLGSKELALPADRLLREAPTTVHVSTPQPELAASVRPSEYSVEGAL